MQSKKLMFVSSIVLLVIALQPQAVCGDSGIMSCEPLSKKSKLAFAIELGMSRTLHCPPPDLIHDELALCCTEDITGIPFCCDLSQYADQNTGIIIGVTSAIIFLVMILCCCCFCYKRYRQPGIIYMPRLV